MQRRFLLLSRVSSRCFRPLPEVAAADSDPGNRSPKVTDEDAEMITTPNDNDVRVSSPAECLLPEQIESPPPPVLMRFPLPSAVGALGWHLICYLNHLRLNGIVSVKFGRLFFCSC